MGASDLLHALRGALALDPAVPMDRAALGGGERSVAVFVHRNHRLDCGVSSGTNWKTFHANSDAKAERDPVYRTKRAIRRAIWGSSCRKSPPVTLAPVGKPE
jgi:hypothetical protein